MMNWIPQIERSLHVANLLEKMEETLAALSECYRFDRFRKTFGERPYFLLSHCAHLTFSLWRIEQDSNGEMFRQVARPRAFFAGLSFDSLRYLDFSRRTLHGDSLEEHIKNETKWFRFWIDTLQKLDPPRELAYKAGSEQLLEQMDTGEFLGPEASRQRQHTIEQLVQTDDFGRLLRHSMSVLEDLSWTTACYLSSLNPKDHAIEQMMAVACRLNQIRRTIVWETPARGPYKPSRHAVWPMPSALGRRPGGRAGGLLKVVPRRDGGGIACTYAWARGAERMRRRWTIAIPALPGPYEEQLFRTWSYEEGTRVDDRKPSPDARACWLVQSAEAIRLERLSQQTTLLLDRLSGHPDCQAVVEAASDSLRGDKARWEPGPLPWTYICQLDGLLERLQLTCREAKVMGGDDAPERAIRKVWGTEFTGKHGGGSDGRNIVNGGAAQSEEVGSLQDHTRC